MRPAPAAGIRSTDDRWNSVDKLSLDAVAREQLQAARNAGSGRAAETVFGGHEKVLRQTVVAMTAGASLAEHENPGEATLQVIQGRVRLVGPHASWEGRDGDLIVIPQSRHSLEAVTDAAVLLTVAKLP
jgi:quercetin dioxygenase-like cupin family protein